MTVTAQEPSVPKNKAKFSPPQVKPGVWYCTIGGQYSLHLGQSVQEGPPKQSVELSYFTLPTIYRHEAETFTWPGVLSIFAPTRLRSDAIEAGTMLFGPALMSLAASLTVTRPQFSDLFLALERNRLKHFVIRTAEGLGNEWPVTSWDAEVNLVV